MAVCCLIENSSVVSGDGLVEMLHRVFGREKKIRIFNQDLLGPLGMGERPHR